jgi:Na+-transporting NADH:ubiquinone oxidoreductase subunit A
MIKIKKGLDLPIAGQPEQNIVESAAVKTVALVGADYVGMKPTMEVSEGDKVKKGQLLFTDKKTEGVRYTAPGGGTVVQVNRGAKRLFQTLVIELDEQEEELTFASFSADQLVGLNRQQVSQQLVDSGEWTALRTRPYSKVPAAGTVPHSIFVNAMDTNPLAADPVVVIAQNREAFANGLKVLPALTDGNVYLSTAPGVDIPSEGAIVKEFAGPHPAGLSGTHIHFVDPVSFNKTVWTIGYQDVIAIGHLFTSGKIYSDRVVALAGPAVNAPALVKTRVGASTTELTAGNVVDGDTRVISGSVLSGRSAKGVMAYLGRYHNQISVLTEGVERKFMGWLSPGLDRFSVMGIYLSQLIGGKRFAMNTSTNGSPRAMVPIGAYEKLMPLDILPTQLLRAMIVADMEVSLDLGVLELDEEDLALCTFSCPGKYEYGPILRDNLTRIEKEC